jgi:hypothetical protein
MAAFVAAPISSKPICLGAKAVLCGRAYAYGLAAAGEAGVARALEILRVDVDRTLKLLGCTSSHLDLCRCTGKLALKGPVYWHFAQESATSCATRC